MSKLSETLNDLRIFNNYELLRRFGDANSVVIEYQRRPDGRLGWARVNKTEIWSLKPLKGLDETKFGTVVFKKEFLGNRSESFYAARNWAVDNFGHDYVPSPFGGLIPKHVRHKAEQAARSSELTSKER